MFSASTGKQQNPLTYTFFLMYTYIGGTCRLPFFVLIGELFSDSLGPNSFVHVVAFHHYISLSDLSMVLGLISVLIQLTLRNITITF